VSERRFGVGLLGRADDDELLLQALEELISSLDPCPQSVMAGAGNVFTWGLVEADLAALLSDGPSAAYFARD
jgi:hypothetical protein